MKRELTEEEHKATKKGLVVRKKRVKDFKEKLEYFKDFKKMNNNNNEFNKKWKDYLDKDKQEDIKSKDNIINQTMTMLENDIKHEQQTIIEQSLHLTEGIEVKKVKEMPGVN